MKRKLITTNDGSHSLFVQEINECYHSRHGSIIEAEHVFIKNGLLAENKKKFQILEVGFGTGLNALLTLQKARQKNIKINYYGIELYPVEKNNYTKLNFSELIGENKNTLLKIHEVKWEEKSEINNSFFLTKHKTSLEEYTSKLKFDIIYFDAFSPNTQPELWTKSIFIKMYNILKDDGFLVTYCAKGSFRRTLKSIGFNVISLDGPLGKRQMTKANRI